MSGHITTPWEALDKRYFKSGCGDLYITIQGTSLAFDLHFPPAAGKSGALATSRRIVAAVNACEGISTEALEDGVVRELAIALKCMLEVFAAEEEFEGFASVSRARAVLAKIKGGA